MLGATLTEPSWILFFIGAAAGYWKIIKTGRSNTDLFSLTLVLTWLVSVVFYVVMRQPAVYDGLRHFLFILPPIFIFIGFSFEWITNLLRNNWLRAGVIVTILLPGIMGIIRLHPYQYTYYNSFVGGTSGVFRRYETDYWLTCYKEAVERLNADLNDPVNLYVRREAYIAEYYAAEHLNVLSLREHQAAVQSGDYILVNTRTNEDRSSFRDAPPVLEISRGDAVFCVVKKVP
jgi:hypothetical protein